MSTNKTKRYLNNPKKIQPVTRKPDFLLKMIGFIDSFLGQTVCDANITKFYKRGNTIEANEIILAEDVLFPSRKEAAIILTGIFDSQNQIDKSSEIGGCDSIEYTRAIRTAKAHLKVFIEKLTLINEIIVNADALMEERLYKTKKKTAEKIHAYITGIRSGKLKSYEAPSVETDDYVQKIYFSKHDSLDNQIREIILSYRDNKGDKS